jgi:hypothetical protein
MRTLIRIAPTTAVANADSLKWGLTVDDQNAVSPSFVTGSGVLDPVTNQYRPWLFIRQEFAVPTFNNLGAGNEIVQDVRAKRKIHELQDTLLLSVSAVAAGAALTTGIYARVLLALP